MRVTDSMLRASALRSLGANMESLAAIQEQVSTTRRLNRPSDDPGQVRQAISLRDALSELGQYARNIARAGQSMSAAETAIASAGDAMQRARELAIQGANDTLAAADRQRLAQEVGQLADTIVQLAAAKVGDSYIFSGLRTDVAPYASASGPYQGDAGAITVRTSPGSIVQTNIPGDAVFAPALAALSQLQTQLATGARPADSTLVAVDGGLSALVAGRTAIGVRQNSLDQTSAYVDQVTTAAQGLLSQLEDADMTQVISRLAERQLAYQAALKVSAGILQQSLLNEIP